MITKTRKSDNTWKLSAYSFLVIGGVFLVLDMLVRLGACSRVGAPPSGTERSA